MTKATKDTNTTKDTQDEATQTRGRQPRKKVYEPVRETHIPNWVQDAFMKDDYELRLVRWAIGGVEDYRNLHRRVQEGYEFVTADELKKVVPQFSATLNTRDTAISKGICTLGDNCLMKVDTELRASRRKHYEGIAQAELASVDVNVLGKKHGLKDTGSSSKVLNREPPSFKN
tara:strand:+ start:6857 stop:7375 length:519 start_codon:yes stop_codon:yes gene_type:complete